MASEDVDAYIAQRPADQRRALEDLRATLRALVPEGEECLSYGVPAIRLPQGPVVAGFAAFKRHLGYYPHSGDVVSSLAEDMQGYSTSAGTIRFTPDDPLPTELVGRLVAARLAEIGG